MKLFSLAAFLCFSPVLAQAQAPDWVAAFRTTISGCWNTAGITEDVTVSFQLDQNGRVLGDILLVAVPNPTAAKQDALNAARRAILRCQGQEGYALPPKAYESWRNVEMTFSLPKLGS